MPRGDLLAVLRDTMPTKPLLDLLAAVWHIESSGTLCSVIDRIFILWCGTNNLHESGSLPQKRPVNELPESQSWMCSCAAAGGATGDPLDGVAHSAQAPS
jgi:hypothetical protein